MDTPGLYKEVITMARKSKYEIIQKNFGKIEQLLNKGITEREVARSIGIAYSTWNKYKAEVKEFSELIEKSREKPVDELINAMYKSGMGFTKKIKRAMKVKEEKYDPITGKKCSSKEKVEYYDEEIYIPPNFQAARFLIVNWGKDLGYSNDPKMLEIREKELEHKIKQDEMNNW